MRRAVTQLLTKLLDRLSITTACVVSNVIEEQQR
jgi:hypothetical protein